MINERETEYESYLVRLLKENGATEEDCKDIDNIWREKYDRSGEYPIKGLAKFIDKRIDSSKIGVGLFSYQDILLISLLEKPRRIPSELLEKIKSFRNVGLTHPAFYCDGKVREEATERGRELKYSALGIYSAFNKGGTGAAFKLGCELGYLSSKMSK
jgi:hypothetical protein